MSEAPATGVESRLIFAMGGGGFTVVPTIPLLEHFVLGLARTTEPRILFLPTASGDRTAQINAFHARFADRLLSPNACPCSGSPVRSARSRRSCSVRTSSTSAADRCATSSRSGFVAGLPRGRLKS